MLRRSSNRALSSTRQTRLLPLLGAVDQRRHERRVVARPVDGRLDRDHLGILRGGLDERLEARRGRTRTAGGRGCRPSAPRRRTRRRPGRAPGAAASPAPTARTSARAGRATRSGCRSARSSCPSISYTCSVDAPSPVDQPVEHLARRGGGHLEPDDVAETAPAKLRLDRLEQVGRVVGDVEVRVAGDPERRALGDLHAGEERGQEVADHRFEGHEAALAADLDEARQPFGHLDAGEALLARSPGRRRERQATARARRCTGTAAPARRRGASARGRSRARTASPASRAPSRCIRRAPRCRCRSRRAPVAARAARASTGAPSRSLTRSRMLVSACCGVRPSAERIPSPEAAWSIRPGTRTMKNSSSISEKIPQNFTRSSSGTAGSEARSSTRSLASATTARG